MDYVGLLVLLLLLLLNLWLYLRNVASLSLFCRYYFGRCSSELAELFPVLHFVAGPLVILINCMIFLSSFLDVTRMSVSTVSSLSQLDSGILCLQNACLTYGFKRHIFFVFFSSFLSSCSSLWLFNLPCSETDFIYIYVYKYAIMIAYIFIVCIRVSTSPKKHHPPLSCQAPLNLQTVQATPFLDNPSLYIGFSSTPPLKVGFFSEHPKY